MDGSRFPAAGGTALNRRMAAASNLEQEVMASKEKDYFQALYEVARVVNASLEPEEVMNQIVESVRQAMGVKAANMRLLDRSRERLLLGGCAGLSEDYQRKGPILVSESGLDRKALAGETVYLADVQNDPSFQYPERARDEGIHSILVVPLMVENQAIGVLRAYSGEVREFSQDEMMFLQAVANLSAIALENARLHAALKRDYDLLVQHEYRLDDN